MFLLNPRKPVNTSFFVGAKLLNLNLFQVPFMNPVLLTSYLSLKWVNNPVLIQLIQLICI